MRSALERRLAQAVEGSALAPRLPRAAAGFLERRSGDPAAARLEGPVLDGLARVVATQPEMAGFLSHRPALLERIASAGPGTLAARARELPAAPIAARGDDLEGALDDLRLLRREDTCLAACIDLGGLASFEETTAFLSVLAETIAQRALALAEGAASGAARGLSVIGMGKLAGRELTYHSDLDLIFLYRGGPEQVAQASRIGQRLIAYLTTMTGAGVAYAVDTRLRPSGHQGMLVTSFDTFERYQLEAAQTWEHLALLRARAFAGAVAPAQAVLDHVRGEVLRRRAAPWCELAELRRRVEAERARESAGAVPFKTGPGGLMDVDFLAGGGLLECGTDAFPVLPTVAAMLRAALWSDRVARLLDDYRFLRLLEARTRWIAGRAVESLDISGESLGAVAELVEPRLTDRGLLERIDAARGAIRAAFDSVIRAGTLRALAG